MGTRLTRTAFRLEGDAVLHLCIDVYSGDTAWRPPWLPGVLPAVLEIVPVTPRE